MTGGVDPAATATEVDPLIVLAKKVRLTLACALDLARCFRSPLSIATLGVPVPRETRVVPGAGAGRSVRVVSFGLPWDGPRHVLPS